jgi:hypothetical protein
MFPYAAVNIVLIANYRPGSVLGMEYAEEDGGSLIS